MAIVDKFNKIVFRPCKGLVIKHQVVFGDKDIRSQKRKSELFQYEYATDKYSDVTEVSNITLDTSDFIVFERTSGNREVDSEQVYVSYPHLFKVRSGLKKAMRWFYDDEYENIYIHSDNDIVFNSDFAKERVEMYGLVKNKTIVLRPTVVEIEDQLYEGVTMHLNSMDVYVEMTLDQLESIYDFFQYFDLYLSSIMVADYVSRLSPENVERMEKGRGRGGGRRGSASLKVPEGSKKSRRKKTGEDAAE